MNLFSEWISVLKKICAYNHINTFFLIFHSKPILHFKFSFNNSLDLQGSEFGSLHFYIYWWSGFKSIKMALILTPHYWTSCVASTWSSPTLTPSSRESISTSSGYFHQIGGDYTWPCYSDTFQKVSFPVSSFRCISFSQGTIFIFLFNSSCRSLLVSKTCTCPYIYIYIFFYV